MLFLRLEKQEHVRCQGNVPSGGGRKKSGREGGAWGRRFPVGADLREQEGTRWGPRHSGPWVEGDLASTASGRREEGLGCNCV